VDNFSIASLAGGAETVGSVAWHTPYIGGHFCLLARADAPKDPIGSGPDTIAPVDVTSHNNNISQKNVNFVDYPKIEACGFYTTTVLTDVVYFDAVNTYAQPKVVDIDLASGDFPLGDGTLVLDPGNLWNRWAALSGFQKDVPNHLLLLTGLPAKLDDVTMGANETAHMTMTITAPIDRNFTVRITERIGATDVGGIDYVRRLPGCIYLPVIVKGFSP
jgi:hypothetical protein